MSAQSTSYGVGDDVNELGEMRGNKLLNARVDGGENGVLDLLGQVLLCVEHCRG